MFELWIVLFLLTGSIQRGDAQGLTGLGPCAKVLLFLRSNSVCLRITTDTMMIPETPLKANGPQENLPQIKKVWFIFHHNLIRKRIYFVLDDTTPKHCCLASDKKPPNWRCHLKHRGRLVNILGNFSFSWPSGKQKDDGKVSHRNFWQLPHRSFLKEKKVEKGKRNYTPAPITTRILKGPKYSKLFSEVWIFTTWFQHNHSDFMC